MKVDVIPLIHLYASFQIQWYLFFISIHYFFPTQEDLVPLIHLECFLLNPKIFDLYFFLFVSFSYEGGFNP
jgi:hypothetical protein